MQITNLPAEFQKALPILQAIETAGFEAYFVGGSVRDTILNLPIHDVDMATSAYPAEIKEIFQKTVDTGIEHGTVMVLDHGEGYEITTFRTESTYQDFRRPDEVTFVRSLAEDLKRRDLTINALAMGADGKIIDLFDGLTDLQNKTIKAVGNPHERYHEDALRMMRTVRFASQLDFTIEPATLAAITANAPLLAKIAVERTHVEWIKLLQGKAVKRGLESFLATDLYKYCPGFATHQADLAKLATVPHLHLVSEVAAWTLICYFFGLTDPQIRPFLSAWKSSNEVINQTKKATKALKALMKQQLTVDLAYEIGLDLLVLANDLARQLKGGYTPFIIAAQWEQLPIKNKAELKINGGILIKELGIKPGPKMGEVLTTLEQQVLHGDLKNDPEVLKHAAKLLCK